MIAYLDTIGGISGDMTLGAFVSAGVPLDSLRDEVSKMGMSGLELEASHVERSGIAATKVSVVISQKSSPHRHLSDIRGIIENSALSPRVQQTAMKIFWEVARAEAKVHATDIEKIHFHEVGALDSLVDIVGTAVCLELLGVEEVYSSAVKVGGGGFVMSEHGKLPVPTPATLEILRDYPIVLTETREELTTPTGAAIVKALSRGTLSSSKLSIRSIGYGAGTKEFESIPNLLRVMIGTLKDGYETDDVVMIETNIDDMNPEIYPYVIERLIAAGAHDAYVLPVLMKKGRPGMLLSTLAERGKLDDILAIVFRETTTLGVRILPIERRKLTRSQRSVKTSFGEIRAKVVVSEGKERILPEFEECKRIAMERNLPLKEVYKTLERELS